MWANQATASLGVIASMASMRHPRSDSVATGRVSEAPSPDDGTRVLVDRLWSRGLTKAEAHVDVRMKDVASRRELRVWLGHDPTKFAEFRLRYQAALAQDPGRSALARLRDLAAREPVTLVLTVVFAAQDTEHCHTSVLRDLRARAST